MLNLICSCQLSWEGVRVSKTSTHGPWWVGVDFWPFLDHFPSLVQIWTKSRILDLIGSTTVINGIIILFVHKYNCQSCDMILNTFLHCVPDPLFKVCLKCVSESTFTRWRNIINKHALLMTAKVKYVDGKTFIFTEHFWQWNFMLQQYDFTLEGGCRR